MQVPQDDALGLLVGPRDVADRAVPAGLQRVVRERDDRVVAVLHLKAVEIDAGAQHPRGGAGLEPAQADAELPQRGGQERGGEHAVRPAFVRDLAHEDFAGQIGAGRKDDRLCRERGAEAGRQLPQAAPARRDGDDLRLAQQQAGLALQLALHDFAVLAPVDLRPQRMDGRPLAAVQHPALDEALVGRAAHLAAERVELADEVPLRRPADGGVARAVSHRVQIDGENNRLTPQASRGEARLDSRVPRADDGHVDGSGVVTQNRFPFSKD